MRTIVKLLLLPAVGALCVGIALAAGLVDFSAAKPPVRLEQRLATFALTCSIARHASKVRSRTIASVTDYERKWPCCVRRADDSPARPPSEPAFTFDRHFADAGFEVIPRV